MRILLTLSLLFLVTSALASNPIVVGSKKFTESVILSEIITALLRADGLATEHRQELGGTRVVWNALLRGDIDIYSDYSGTLRHEVLANEHVAPGLDGLREALARHGIRMSAPLGFHNGYALGMQRATAERLGIRSVSDLRNHPNLRIATSNEFLRRSDGWPGLKKRYQLPQQAIGIDHDLGYRGLDAGSIDVLALYTTDAGIRQYDLLMLDDDRRYFPPYQAVILSRQQLPAAILDTLDTLSGQIDEATMIAMNATVKLDGVSEAATARDFLQQKLAIQTTAATDQGRWSRLWQRSREHLFMVLVSLSAAILVALPLGILAARKPRLGQLLLAATGVLQTLPALALLVFMIPLLGIGAAPAIAALFLYSLLPIVRNTHTGLSGIPRPLLESADALGLSSGTRLRLIELPLAAPAILSGIKTAAVINIGTATLGALIGAGGYGQPILTGIRLDDIGLILEGAIPSALLALAVQGLLELAERWAVPRGLRLEQHN
jgi:osmoprotectant transport system permease protein